MLEDSCDLPVTAREKALKLTRYVSRSWDAAMARSKPGKHHPSVYWKISRLRKETSKERKRHCWRELCDKFAHPWGSPYKIAFKRLSKGLLHVPMRLFVVKNVARILFPEQVITVEWMDYPYWSYYPFFDEEEVGHITSHLNMVRHLDWTAFQMSLKKSPDLFNPCVHESSNTRTKKSPPSTPFLGSGNINDFYKGELAQLMHDVSSSTYSFVFFYAPWDADCQDLKYEFLEAAEFYVDKVYFAGVNCWEPGSECRARFKDVVERYPQLVAYVGLERAAALVGYLNVHSTSDYGLGLLHETSLSLASRDHVRQIAIGVFTNIKYNSDMNVTATPTIHLYVWNKKFVYDGALKRGSLLKWVMETSSGLLMSINGMLLLKTPIVVMFSPIRPLELISPNYIMSLQREIVKYDRYALEEGLVQEFVWHLLDGTISPVEVSPNPDGFHLCSEDGKKIHNDWREEACRMAERTSPLPSTIPSPAQSLYVNSTFTFACLDSGRFEHLAQALGIEISSEPASTVVLIIGDEEMVKIGRGELREERLWLGLSDWSQGKIKRVITGRRDRPSPKPFFSNIGSIGRVQTAGTRFTRVQSAVAPKQKAQPDPVLQPVLWNLFSQFAHTPGDIPPVGRC
ncbi:unnamed protein product [Nezara viridula]|uniref:Thioredoxin domain-containing protein n=1 Tax=Nezara viridula TaxID=85310 RepID=A0A9P0H241_NEZVI|nr:unnamed protein product [Nezara viridula]